jgi:dynactin 1
MDHLQTDIDSLESEKGELKERLKSICKKSGSASTPGADGSLNTSITSNFGPPAQDNMMQEKVEALRKALKEEARQKQSLLCENLKRKLQSLPLLPKYEQKPKEDEKIKELLQKKTELLRVSCYLAKLIYYIKFHFYHLNVFENKN